MIDRRRGRVIGAVAAMAAMVVLAGACGTSDGSRATSAGTGASGTTVGSGWMPLATMPYDAYGNHVVNPTSVWTGTELIVPSLGAAPIYDPAGNTWRLSSSPPVQGVLSTTQPPSAWTGHEMISVNETALDQPATHDDQTGPLVALAYDPAADSWRRLADPPAGRTFSVLVWTGAEVLVWGHGSGVSAYHPETDSWEVLTTEPAPTGVTVPGFLASAQDAFWDGSELLAFDEGGGPGAAFDPTTRTWRSLPDLPQQAMTFGWTGTEVLALDGETGKMARIEPKDAAWHDAAPGPFTQRSIGAAVWVDGRFVVWGGQQFDYTPASTPMQPVADGAAYDPVSDTWSAVPALPAGTPADLGGVAAGPLLVAWGVTVHAPGPTQALVAASWSPTG